MKRELTNRRAVVATAICVWLLVGFAAWAADIPLFVETGRTVQQRDLPAAARAGRSDAFRAATRSRRVALTPAVAALDRITPSDRMIIDLFDGSVLTARVDRVVSNPMETVSVRGRIEGSEMGYVLISSRDDESLGWISVPERGILCAVQFEASDRAHFLLDLHGVDLGILEEAPPLVPPEKTIRQPDDEPVYDEPSSGKTGEGPILLEQTSEGQTVIDVLVVYTPAARSWAGGTNGMATLISQIMGQAQLVHDNSGTLITKHLVHAAEVDYTESINPDTGKNDSLADLNQLTNGHIDHVHTWRDQYGADLVVFLTKVDDVGGLAWLLTHKNGLPDYAFSITRVQQASWSYTVIHEMGHNMGAHHHKQQNVQPGPTSWGSTWPENTWSAGWRWASGSDRYCSVMTYQSGQYFSDGHTHKRVAYFSNPNIQYQGVATGHAEHGDNARTLREMRHVIANYRGTVIPYELMISGMVLSQEGPGIPGVTLEGLPGPPVTDSDGMYSAFVPSGWSGTVTPQHPDFVFTPVQQTYTDITTDRPDEDYTGTLLRVWTGAAADNDWGQAANWGGSTIPLFNNETDLTWQAADAGHLVSTLGDVSNRTVRSITFNSNVDQPVSLQTQRGASDPEPVSLTFSSDSGNAWISVEAGAAGDIALGGAGAIRLESSLSVTNNGSGTLTLSGIQSTNNTELSIFGDGVVRLEGAPALHGNVVVQSGTVGLHGEATGTIQVDYPGIFGGNATLEGDLILTAAARLDFKPGQTIHLTNGTLSLDEYDSYMIYNIVNLDSTIPPGTYCLVDGPVQGLLYGRGYENRVELGGSLYAYFVDDETSLTVVVVDEAVGEDPIQPQIESISIQPQGANTWIQVDFTGSGGPFILQHSTNLVVDGGGWTDVAWGSSPLSHTNSAATGFYRIRAE